MTPRRILVVDDVASMRMLMSAIVADMGHEVDSAGDGAEALTKCETFAPHLVIMDVAMPVMDGVDASRHILKRYQGRIPVVLISGDSSESAQLNGLHSGALDYLTKPIQPVFLTAKIRAIDGMLTLRERLQEHADALEEARNHMVEDLELGRRVLEHVTQRGPQHRHLQTWMRYSDPLGGDLIVSDTSPDGQLYLLLADATGHGAAASLTITLLLPIFYSMAKKGFRPGVIAAELNDRLHGWLPRDRFIAATLAVIDFDKGAIELWNGGNPAAYFLADTGEHTVFPPRHLALGILSAQEFDRGTQAMHIGGPGQLVVWSDGIVDSTPGTDLVQWFSSVPPAHRLPRWEEESTKLTWRDDGALAIVTIDRSLVQASNEGAHVAHNEAPARWKMSFQLTNEHVLYDFVPTTLSWLESLGVEVARNSHIFIVLTELLSNAVDHGIRGVSSESRRDWDSPYDRRKVEEVPEGALLELRLERDVDALGPLLRIEVADSGAGFDPETIVSHSEYSGRGLKLIGHFVESLSFAEGGRRAVATVRLQSAAGGTPTPPGYP